MSGVRVPHCPPFHRLPNQTPHIAYSAAPLLMASRLILNADDFGLTPGINRAIAELHGAGALTSATLMATGAAFDDAISITQINPKLGVGCHIVLSDGVPVSDPGTLPTLCPDGKT